MTKQPVTPKIIAVLGSHRLDPGSEAYALARLVGTRLAEAGYTVCNGGYGGVMEASARGAREAGGRTLGMTISGESRKVNAWIETEIESAAWEDRLLALIDRADGYVFCDGGTGTLTELFVVWEKTNQKLIRRPIIIVGEYLKTLMRQFRADPLIRWSDWIMIAENADEIPALLNRS